MLAQALKNPLFRSKFLHYFLVIGSMVFLFTLGPRILVDQLANSNPNTAIAQDCGQQPCPSVPVPPQPPQECTTSCPAGKSGTCGGHKYWVEAEGAYGECRCETESSTCSNPAPPPPACEKDKVVGTVEDCDGNKVCTFNVQQREDCSTYRGGPFACHEVIGRCGVNPPPQATTPPSSVCTGTPCDRPVGESTCSNNRLIFCKKDGPECGGVGCNCMVDTGSTCNVGGSNPPPPPSNTCTDRIFNCVCIGTNFQCTHQRSDCSNVLETHNELGFCQAIPLGGGSSNSNSSSNSTSNSNSNSTANANATANQTQTQSQAQITSINNTNNNTNNNNLTQSVNVGGTNFIWATPSPTATVTPTPTATATSTIINRTTTVIVGQGGGSQPLSKAQVKGTVQELPNTGLPLVGLAFLGFIPIGWRMRKYAFKTLDPSSIWTSRELKK